LIFVSGRSQFPIRNFRLFSWPLFLMLIALYCFCDYVIIYCLLFVQGCW